MCKTTYTGAHQPTQLLFTSVCRETFQGTSVRELTQSCPGCIPTKLAAVLQQSFATGVPGPYNHTKFNTLCFITLSPKYTLSPARNSWPGDWYKWGLLQIQSPFQNGKGIPRYSRTVSYFLQVMGEGSVISLLYFDAFFPPQGSRREYVNSLYKKKDILLLKLTWFYVPWQ